MIEALASVLIVSLGLVAAIKLIGGSLYDTIDSRNQVTAALLAQEGLELVRNVRDNNWASGTKASFDSGSGFPAVNATDCAIFYNTANINCSPGSRYLKLNADKFYGTDSSGKFQRRVIITYDTGSNSSANEAVVTSVVVWKSAFPGDPIDDSSCNSSSKCSYARTVLSGWKH